VFRFQTYSTALSVTIAIGVSLLVLNILIFATFYYEREKRLSILRRSTSRAQAKKKEDQSNFTSSSPGLQLRTSSQPQSSSLKRRKENGVVGSGSGCGESMNTSSFYDADQGGEIRCCNDPRVSNSELADLHLSTYVNVDEDSCGSTVESATVGEVSYVNYPIKRYSECSGSVGTILRSGSLSGNRQRRAINELPIPIDMSESLTNDPNFSPQSSPYRTLEIGTTFVGMETLSYRGSQEYPSHILRPQYSSSAYHQQQRHQEDNSSIDDGQSSQ